MRLKSKKMNSKNFKQNLKTKKIILQHFNRYPKMQLCDMLKFLFHSAFGCDHLVSSLEKAEAYIAYEFNKLKPSINKVEKLDGKYSRVHLGIINKGLSEKTLAKLFYLSAKKEPNGVTLLNQKLNLLENTILNCELPFNHAEFCEFCSEWKKLNYPAIHHSQIFNQEYKPSYRVISNKYLPYIPLLKKIDLRLNDENCKQFNLSLCLNLQKNKEKTEQILNQIYGDLNIKICLARDKNNQTFLQITK